MTNLPIQAKVTKTAAFLGAGVDISAITGDWTLVLEILAQNAGDVTRFAFETSNNSFTTYNTDIFSGPTVSVSGEIDKAQQKRYTFQKRDFPAAEFGVTSTSLRLNLMSFTGSSKSVTYQAWVEY